MYNIIYITHLHIYKIDIYIYIYYTHAHVYWTSWHQFLILNLCQAVEAQVSRLPAGDFCSARGLLKVLVKTLPDKKAEFAENQGSKDPQSLFSMET